jgi:hypothetical protein
VKQHQTIPFYGPDGASLGYRTPDAAERLMANGSVNPVYGRKGHLKGIFLRCEDGSSRVETHARTGTRYSFLQNLDSGGRCWKLRRVDGRDDDSMPVSTRGVFLQVLKDCLVA